MGYATSAQCTGEFKDLTVGASTAISSTDVTGFIADADAEINTILSVKYQTPITGTEALIVMKMVEVWLVKQRIQDILSVKSGVPAAEQGADGKGYRQMALELLKKLTNGTAKLTDATLATSADGVKSYTSQEDTANVFDVSINQW